MAPIHILVILPRWVGDFVMATPMLRALQNHFGSKARISGVCKPLFADLLEGTSWLDKIVFYDRRSRDPANRFTAVARKLRDDRADIALIVPNSLSTAATRDTGDDFCSPIRSHHPAKDFASNPPRLPARRWTLPRISACRACH